MNGNNLYNYINNMSIENNAYKYITNKNRAKLGQELVEFIKTNGCDPKKIFSKISNKNNKGGFHLRKIKTTRPIRYSHNGGSLSKSKRGIAKLGSGTVGTIYIGCIDKQCKKEVAIKEAVYVDIQTEYAIAKKIQGVVSPHVARVYALSKCGGQGFMYSEYFPGNSMLEWLTQNKSHLRPIYIRNMIFQVLYTLRKIQQTYPGFRHNDLHGGNIFINDKMAARGSVKYTVDGLNYYVKNAGVSACIADFGYASMPGMKNPMANLNHMKTNYGIGPKSHPLYDAHLFLNSVYVLIKNIPQLATTKKFIESVLSEEYLGGKDTGKIHEFRLMYGTGATHPNLPTIKKILASPYFRNIMSKKINGVINTFPVRKLGGGGGGPRPVRKKSLKKMNTIYEVNETLIRLSSAHSPKKIRTPPPSSAPSIKYMIKFIITNGTKKAKLDLASGNKLPSKNKVVSIMTSFAKGRKILGRVPPPPPPPPPPPSKNTKARYPATYANIRRMTVKRGKRPVAVVSSSSPNTKALKNGIGNARPKAKPKFINFSKTQSKSTGRIKTSVIRAPKKQNKVQLNAVDMRTVRALREKISNNMANTVPDFAARETKAYDMAIAQVRNHKRMLINLGLEDAVASKAVKQIAATKQLSPLAKKPVGGTAKKLSPPPVRVSTVKSGVVGIHTGKKIKTVAVSSPLQAKKQSNFTLNGKNRLKIKGRMCDSHKKEDIQAYLKSAGISYTQKNTKAELCSELRKKYL